MSSTFWRRIYSAFTPQKTIILNTPRRETARLRPVYYSFKPAKQHPAALRHVSYTFLSSLASAFRVPVVVVVIGTGVLYYADYKFERTQIK